MNDARRVLWKMMTVYRVTCVVYRVTWIVYHITWIVYRELSCAL
ncbi:MAG TPA: hypothetical protein VE978_00630 [Chitinophagales bacterium]|nr:hypothetical protein [Chitinophagales bacterium]